MIDFEQFQKPVQAFIASSLQSFAAERSEVTWSTFGLLVYPMGGWISANFDTEANSTEIVAYENGAGAHGKDEWGLFNNSCADFEYIDWRFLKLPTWEQEYHGADADDGRPLHVRDLDGCDHFIGTENVLICRLAFAFCRTVLCEQVNAMRGSPVFPKTRHRFGVHIPHSDFADFWRAEDVIG